MLEALLGPCWEGSCAQTARAQPRPRTFIGRPALWPGLRPLLSDGPAALQAAGQGDRLNLPLTSAHVCCPSTATVYPLVCSVLFYISVTLVRPGKMSPPAKHFFPFTLSA